jgi:hypothetical protein
MSSYEFFLWVLSIVGCVAVVALSAWGISWLHLKYVEHREKIAQRRVAWMTASAEESAIQNRIAQERMNSDRVITDLRTELERSRRALEEAKKDVLAKRVEELEGRLRSAEAEKARLANEISAFKITGGDPRWSADAFIDQLMSEMSKRHMVVHADVSMPTPEAVAGLVVEQMRADVGPVIVQSIVDDLTAKIDMRTPGVAAGVMQTQDMSQQIAAVHEAIAAIGQMVEQRLAARDADSFGGAQAPSQGVDRKLSELGDRLGELGASIETIAQQAGATTDRTDRLRTEILQIVTGGFEAVERVVAAAPRGGGDGAGASGGAAPSGVAIEAAVRRMLDDAASRIQACVAEVGRTSPDEAAIAGQVAASVGERIADVCRTAVEDSIESLRLALQPVSDPTVGRAGRGGDAAAVTPAPRPALAEPATEEPPARPQGPAVAAAATKEAASTLPEDRAPSPAPAAAPAAPAASPAAAPAAPPAAASTPRRPAMRAVAGGDGAEVRSKPAAAPASAKSENRPRRPDMTAAVAAEPSPVRADGGGAEKPAAAKPADSATAPAGGAAAGMDRLVELSSDDLAGNV